MWKRLRLNQLSTQLAWFVVLIGLLIASVLTFKLPERSADVSVGSYVLGSFPSGLAFYSGQGSANYYSISPLNDYFITAQGYRTALAATTSTANEDHIQQEIDTLKSYIGISLPEYNTYRADHLRYTTKRLDQHTVEVTRTLKAPSNPAAVTTGITLSYDDDSYVFSPDSGSVFSDQSEAQLNWLAEQSDLTLNKMKVPTEYQSARLFTWELTSNKVVLFNPAQAGYIVVQANSSQSILINPKDKLIEVVESVPADSKSITISVQISIVPELPTK